jgi:hypothetical protein
MMTEPADLNARNPYAAPESVVDDLALSAEVGPAFFAVGLPKLAVMTLCTFGIYEIYWFYQNWKSVQRLTGEKLNAPIRAVFYPLTSYFLFRRIREQAQRLQVDVTIKAGALATFLFLFSAASRLPHPYWLFSLLVFLPLVSVQLAVDEINRKVAPEADRNGRFGPWNVLVIVIGGLLLILSIVHLLLGEDGAA